MSLILEALRKLEREKQAPDRGFLVMAHTPWGAGRRWSILAFAGLLLAVAVAASLATAIVLRRGLTPVAPPTGAASPQPAGGSVPAPVGAQGPRAATAPSTPSPAAPVPQAKQDPVAPSPQATPQAAASVPPAVPARAPSQHPAAPPLPELRLMAISQQDGRPVAILNDRLVREGDSFDGVRIVRIGDTEVEVEVHGQKRVLTFQ